MGSLADVGGAVRITGAVRTRDKTSVVVGDGAAVDVGRPAAAVVADPRARVAEDLGRRAANVIFGAAAVRNSIVAVGEQHRAALRQGAAVDVGVPASAVVAERRFGVAEQRSIGAAAGGRADGAAVRRAIGGAR